MGKFTILQNFKISFIGTALAVILVLDIGLMKFFTDVVGISPILFGTVSSIMAIVSVFLNLIAGIYIDRKKQYLKLMRISIPFITVLAVLILYIQPHWDSKVIFAALLGILFVSGFFKTLFTMSYTTYVLNITDNTQDRTEISVMQKYLAFVPAALNSLIPALMFTGDFTRETITTIFLICVVIGFFLTMFSMKGLKEEYLIKTKGEKPVTFSDIKTSIKLILSSKHYIYYFLSGFIINGVVMTYYTGYLYYMDNVMMVSGIKAVLPDVLGAGVQIVIYGLIIKSVSKLGSRDTLKYGMLVTILCYTGLTFSQNYIVVTALYALSMVGLAVTYVIMAPFFGTLIDMEEMETGVRKAGILSAVNAVIMIPSAGVMTALFSAILEKFNYDGTLAAQSAHTVKGIRIAVGIVPAALLLISLIPLALIPLNRQKEKDVETKLKLSREGNG